MQSGYGVSEMQQFMVDGICPSPFFPSPAADMSQPNKHHHHHHHNNHQPLSFLQHHQHQEQHQEQQQQQQHQQQHQQQQEEYHPHQLHFQEHHSAPPPLPQQMQPRFQPHFHHPVPITHQLFHQTHQFHLFQQEQQGRRLHDHQHQHHLGLDHHSRPTENSASPPSIDVGIGGAAGGTSAGGGISSFLGPSMSFRLSVNENADGSRDELNNDDGILHGDEVDGSETRWPPPPTSRGEVESNIKEPFWRPLDLEMDYINRNSKRCKEKNDHRQQQRQEEQEQEEQEQEQENLEIECSGGSKHFKEIKEVTNGDADNGRDTGSNYKLFSELEAICKSRTTATLIGNNNNNNQTGSSSALTGENLQTTMADPSLMDDDNPNNRVALTSDASTGDEASLKQITTSNGSKRVSDEGDGMRSKRRRKRRKKEKKKQLRSIAVFLESLVKQLIDHQDALHRKFLEVLEKREQARMAMEETWRHQDADKSTRQLKAREEQRAITEAREATIVSFLEKITGESVNLPTEPQSLELKNQLGEGDDENNENSRQHQASLSSNRWPKAEVQDLIRVRSGLEARFQEPGLKGPLWEEVSSVMNAMGYRRNSKRCKEKWENINKYFRKTKESAKKRSQHSNTCPYFHQLDQLYSKNKINATAAAAPTTSACGAAASNVEHRGNSELLYAIVASNDQSGFNYSDLSPVGMEFTSNNYNIINTIGDDLNVAATSEMAVAGDGRLLKKFRRGSNHEEEFLDGEDGRDDEDEEGGGEERERESFANIAARNKTQQAGGVSEEDKMEENKFPSSREDSRLLFAGIQA